LFEKHSTSDPTAWIDASAATGIAVGVAHGTVEGVQTEPDYPIPRHAASRSRLDYLALGHWHSFGPIDDDPHICYSGTHEATKFGEPRSGHVALVEIAARGAPPQVNAVRSGTLAWRTLGDDAKILLEGDLARLRGQIEALPDTSSMLLRVHLWGVLYPSEVGEIERIKELLASRFPIYWHLDTAQLLPRPDDDSWQSEVPAGVMKTVAARLRELSRADYTGARPADATPAVAAQALVELYRLLHEVRA
jgi:hypothetical protein